MRSKTVLDHVHPTVVVRRRIYDPAQFHEAAPTAPEAAVAVPPAVSVTLAEPQIFERTHAFLPTQSWGASDEDESGPPSSVNVARALASLRSDELQRLEDLIHEDEDDDDGPASSVIAPPVSLGPHSVSPVSRAPLSTAHVQLPSVRLPQQIALTDLALGMNIPPDELVTALVTHGFFTVAQTSVLARDTARLAADMFGWRTADMTAEEDAEYAARQVVPRATRKRAAPAKKKAATKRR